MLKRKATTITSFFSKKQKLADVSSDEILADFCDKENLPASSHAPGVLRCEETDNTDVEYCDPANPLPLNKTERDSRIKRGPHRPKLPSYPKTTKDGKNRSFRLAWFQEFEWLEYSPVKDAAFCFCCRIFGLNTTGTMGQVDPAFTTVGFSCWKNAPKRFSNHEKTACHQNSVAAWHHYTGTRRIDVVIDKSRQSFISQQEKTRVKNREIMGRFIDVILLIVQEGWPLRGHNEAEGSLQKGLFLELLDFIAKYDSILLDHLKNAPKNAVYTSPDIQNQLIMSIKNVIKRKLRSFMENSLISVIADETSDVGHHEQMSVIFRFNNQASGVVVEHLVALKRLSSLDSESIFNAIDLVLEDYKIDWKNVISVCFDGAATMAGTLSGVQKRCKDRNRNITYVHCYAHCLNLVLVDSCDYKYNPLAADFFGNIQFLYSFIEGSAIRHGIFEKLCSELNSRLKTLKSLSTTRWACRKEAVAAISANYPAILLTLEQIIENTKLHDVRVKGRGILSQIRTFNFIFGLKLMEPILADILQVSKVLQDPKLDLIMATSCVKSLRNGLVEARSNQEFFKKIYDSATAMCDELAIEIPPVKSRKISSRIDNCRTEHTYETKETETLVRYFNPFLDHLVTGIDARFSQEALDLIEAMGNFLNLEPSDAHINVLSKKFRVCSQTLESEIRLLRGLTDTPKGTTNVSVWEWRQWFTLHNRNKIFNDFFRVIVGFQTIPVSSSGCERGFSSLTRVKSKLRATQKQERTESLLMMNVEKEIVRSITTEEVIDEFKKLVPYERRMLL